ncbi:MATE family efflux transporter [Fusobacterium sp.]|uniref:MATE family efflux transporter n=1 Tax=Fusobacterium sp. TaxID=68766 RepID=UPI002617ECE4|nr:MATE family efflux transporter [Fusobacterium sp.]
MFRSINLKEDSITKLFFYFSVPSVTAMLITALYAIVDGIFVGRFVGADALAAVTIGYPIVNLGVAISFLFGMGGATLMSLHSRNLKFKNACFSHLITLNIISYFIILGTVFLLNNKLMFLLGSNEELLPIVKEYAYTCTVALIFLMLANSLNAVVRNDKSPTFAFLSMVSGAITNIFLDWLFIVVFGWGLFGGALATGIGQFVSFMILVSYFFRSTTNIKYRFEKIKLVFFLKIINLGFPSFTIEFAAAVTNTLLNVTFMNYSGPLGVSSYSVVTYICYMFRMVFSGFGQALQPIASFNYGIKEYKRVKEIFKIGHIAAFIISSVLLLFIIFYGENIIKLFTEDEPLIEMSCKGILLFSSALMFLGANFVNIAYLQAKGSAKLSNILSILRSVVFVLLAVIILPPLWGETGIWLVLPASDLFTFLTSCFLLKRIMG